MAEVGSPQEYKDPNDWLLQVLLDWVNAQTASISFDIILQVGGTIVSGHVISGKEYVESFAEIFTSRLKRSAASSDLGTDWIDKIHTELMQTAASMPIKVDEEDRPDVAFINLRNVYIPSLDSEIDYIRYKVADVNGWAMGRLSKS